MPGLFHGCPGRVLCVSGQVIPRQLRHQPRFAAGSAWASPVLRPEGPEGDLPTVGPPPGAVQRSVPWRVGGEGVSPRQGLHTNALSWLKDTDHCQIFPGVWENVGTMLGFLRVPNSRFIIGCYLLGFLDHRYARHQGQMADGPGHCQGRPRPEFAE